MISNFRLMDEFYVVWFRNWDKGGQRYGYFKYRQRLRQNAEKVER